VGRVWVTAGSSRRGPGSGDGSSEVACLLSLGATLVDDQRRPDGTGWVVLADPEGNEFCVERSARERTAN